MRNGEQRVLVASAARQYLAGDLTFEQVFANAPENSDDSDIAEVLDLIEHEPAVGGLLRVSPAAHELHLAELLSAIQRLEQQ